VNRPIAATDLAGEVLARYPDLLPVFLAHGFTPLANPVFRKTIARHVSVESACRLLGIDIGLFVQALNASRSPSLANGEPMPRSHAASASGHSCCSCCHGSHC
jgi:hypothetical protein